MVEEFGWERVDLATAAWIAEQQGGAPEEALAAWQDGHAGLHGSDELRRALDTHFTERSLEWRPQLHRSLERAELEPREREEIVRGEILPTGFRYVGIRQ